MPRIIIAVAAFVGVALLGAPATSFAQPSHRTSQRDIAPPGQGAGNGRGSGADSQAASGRRPSGQGPYAQGSNTQGAYAQGSSGRGGYDQGGDSQQGYAPAGPPPCAEEDDLESLRCHHRTHSRGWYYRSEREAYLRGDHYRGYRDDGLGRRRYDRGGYGVGHFDYTRDYDPLRGY